MISATDKIKKEEDWRNHTGRQNSILNKVVRKVLNDKLTFEQRIEAHVCDTNILDRINSRRKGPEAAGMPEMFKE